MRCLKTLSKIKNYTLESCFFENIDEKSKLLQNDFLKMINVVINQSINGMINNVNELQIEPSIKNSSKSIQSKRYTILIKKCICKSCGGSNYFLKYLKNIIINLNLPSESLDWLYKNLIVFEKMREDVNLYLSCDIGDKVLYKIYLEYPHQKMLSMPLPSDHLDYIRASPDIISVEYENAIKKE